MKTPAFGFADLHCHVMAHLGFGGRLFAGLPEGKIEEALHRCDKGPHGLWGLGRLGNKWSLVQAFIEGGLGHGPCGHDTFADWPSFHTVIHQQVFEDWLRRAYDGGLRLLCSLAVNNELLAEQFGSTSASDQSAIEAQVKELRAFAGRHAAWMGFAASPLEARQLIAAGRLAVIAGVEVDSIDSIRGDRKGLNASPLGPAAIPGILGWLREQGVSMLTPLHLANNSFGGTAIYGDKFNLLNHYLRGQFINVVGNPDVAFRLSQNLVLEDLAAIVFYELTHGAPYPHARYDDTSPGLGHANERGLTPLGETFLREAMRQGFILDVDHMSERTTGSALTLAERLDYPVISSHSTFREQALAAGDTSMMTKRSHEGMKTRDHARRILALGGLLAPISNQLELRDFPGTTVPNDCARSSKTWAQAYQYAVALQREVGKGGVAIGTDFNGLNQQPGPRYGGNAAFGLKGEGKRHGLRLSQIQTQLGLPQLPYGGKMYRTGAPFEPSRVGSRTYDFNTYGLAHYGLLPDFILDLVHAGMKDEQLDPLFQSADAFLGMWERCRSRAEALTAEPPRAA